MINGNLKRIEYGQSTTRIVFNLREGSLYLTSMECESKHEDQFKQMEEFNKILEVWILTYMKIN